ncbi:hypothetical protein OXX69_013870, partial [Metschnikowia pulcherrima]
MFRSHARLFATSARAFNAAPKQQPAVGTIRRAFRFVAGATFLTTVGTVG